MYRLCFVSAQGKGGREAGKQAGWLLVAGLLVAGECADS
jgi:hypothetical protein